MFMSPVMKFYFSFLQGVGSSSTVDQLMDDADEASHWFGTLFTACTVHRFCHLVFIYFVVSLSIEFKFEIIGTIEPYLR